jgi:hypothetical protein
MHMSAARPTASSVLAAAVASADQLLTFKSQMYSARAASAGFNRSSTQSSAADARRCADPEAQMKGR